MQMRPLEIRMIEERKKKQKDPSTRHCARYRPDPSRHPKAKVGEGEIVIKHQVSRSRRRTIYRRKTNGQLPAASQVQERQRPEVHRIRLRSCSGLRSLDDVRVSRHRTIMTFHSPW
jgi:hypothetical protein